MAKFNNPIVVFDLETTDCDKHAIIEIGAVALNRNLDEIGRFQSLVNPSPFPISDFVFDLTGLDSEEFEKDGVSLQPGWNEAASALEGWIGACFGKTKNVRLAAWGNYFDINVLRNEYARRNRPYPFNGTCLDVKTVALMWLSLSGRRTDSCSVQGMVDILDLWKPERYHRALPDAIATANIFREMLKQIEGGVWVGQQYVRVGL